jgi:hypothetical protein
VIIISLTSPLHLIPSYYSRDHNSDDLCETDFKIQDRIFEAPSGENYRSLEYPILGFPDIIAGEKVWLYYLGGAYAYIRAGQEIPFNIRY